jgi:hypothetical protein
MMPIRMETDVTTIVPTTPLAIRARQWIGSRFARSAEVHDHTATSVTFRFVTGHLVTVDDDARVAIKPPNFIAGVTEYETLDLADEIDWQTTLAITLAKAVSGT